MLTRLVVGVLAIALSAAPAAVLAAPGDLDATFGSGGVVTTPVAGDSVVDAAHAIARYADGRYIVVGQVDYFSSTADFALVRYLSGGGLDTTFDTDGIKRFDVDGLGIYRDGAHGVLIQPDQNIVVVGFSEARTVVARFEPSGALDTTFASGGVYVESFIAGNNLATAWGVVRQADGALVVVATYGVFRLTAAGALDTSFGSGGVVLFGGRAIALQSDGKIVTAGADGNSWVLRRLNTDGSLDGTFDTDGIVDGPPYGTSATTAFGVAVQPDGSIVAAGQWQGAPGDPSYLFVKRYSPGGVPLQESFVFSQASGFGIAVQPDGKVIATGATISGPLPHPLLLERHRHDIALDATFSGDGLLTTNTGNGHDEGRAVLVEADGKIVVAGITWPTGPTTQGHFGVVRYEGGPVCGNSTLDAGEQCDDGNNVNGDCCAFTCFYEGSGSPCTGGGTCDGAGTCIPPPTTTTTTTLPPRSRCATAKFRAAGRKTTSKTACHATAVMKAASPDPACLAKAEAKFSSSFARADAQGFGCLTTGDAAAIEAKIDTLVADLVSDLGSGGPSKCSASKYKNAGKKVNNKFACQALALTKGAVVDSACLAKAEAKFSSAFAKAEAGPDCLTTGDTAAIESDVDALVGDVTGDLVP